MIKYVVDVYNILHTLDYRIPLITSTPSKTQRREGCIPDLS